MKKRQSPPSKEKIIEYWSLNYEITPLDKHGHLGRGHECGMGADESEWHERCWCCARLDPLERCHIIPHSIGGSNHPSNFVLLCGVCHQLAPNCNDEHEIWRFIYKNRAKFYYTKEQYEFMDSRIEHYIENVSAHFGHGNKLNNSTAEWINRNVQADMYEYFYPDSEVMKSAAKRLRI